MGFLRNIRKGIMFLRTEQAPDAECLNWIKEYLSQQEYELFIQMDAGDQIHSLHVAELCRESLQFHPEADECIIMRAALLHDIGKIGARLGLGFRTFWVLGHKLAPWLMDRIAKRSTNTKPGTLRYRMYLQFFHSQIGADMMRKIGVEEEVAILIEGTAETESPSNPLPLRILNAADGDRVFKG